MRLCLSWELRRARPNFILDFSGASDFVNETEPKGVIGMKRLIDSTNLTGSSFTIMARAGGILGLITLVTNSTAARGTNVLTAALPPHTSGTGSLAITVVNTMRESAMNDIV